MFMKRTIYIINAILFMGCCLLVSTTTPNVKDINVNKIRKNPGYMFFFPEIIKIDDNVLSPTKETYENLPRKV